MLYMNNLFEGLQKKMILQLSIIIKKIHYILIWII